MRSEMLMVVTMEITAFWDVTICNRKTLTKFRGKLLSSSPKD
jgi:hypothetical protein